MTKVEKIITLLNNYFETFGKSEVDTNTLADYLYKNGIIVPPCRIYDSVYLVTNNGKIDEYIVVEIGEDDFESSYVVLEKSMSEYSTIQMICNFEAFGVTAFTRHADAEKALAKITENK